jgi:hypothetical protein
VEEVFHQIYLHQVIMVLAELQAQVVVVKVVMQDLLEKQAEQEQLTSVEEVVVEVLVMQLVLVEQVVQG